MYSQHQSLNLCYTILQSSPHLTQASASHVLDTILWTIATEHAVLYYTHLLSLQPFILITEVNWSLYMYMRLKIESSPSIGYLAQEISDLFYWAWRALWAHHHHLLYLTDCMSCQTISSSHHPTIDLIPSFSICIVVPVYGDRHCQNKPSWKRK